VYSYVVDDLNDMSGFGLKRVFPLFVDNCWFVPTF